MLSARIACIVVPLFPLAARLRSEPGLTGAAVAVFEGNGNAARVVAATKPARRAGIQAGHTLPQARALLPDLLARGRDRESERAAQEALTEIADGFSPRVESAEEGVVYFDAAGIPMPPPSGAPHPGPLPAGGEREKALGQAVIAAIEKAGLPARFGIAASKLAARVAAGLPDSPTVVPEGEEASFLAPLPLARLAPEMELADTLERWGLRSIGELAKLPEGEVASRLGELGRELHATARGIDPRPLEPRLPPPSLSEGMELEWPLVSLEPFLFVGNAALERLVCRLEGQGLACRRLEVGLKLDPEGYDARAITLPAPTRDVKTLLTLTRLELEARPPGAPVVGFTFTAQPDRARQAQLALFGPAALSPDRLATTIARLVAMLGADRVGSPRAVDGHVPERLAIADYSPPPPPLERRAPRTGRGLLAIRVLRPPVELEVTTRVPLSPPGGERVGVRGDSLRPLSLKSTNGAEPDISGAVRVAAGPWSLEEGWWSAAPASRDYWDVELASGGLYRIYRDRASEKWFADGMYD
jgi:protein ImuB